MPDRCYLVSSSFYDTKFDFPEVAMDASSFASESHGTASSQFCFHSTS